MKMKTRNLEWKKILEVAKQAAIEAGDNALKHYTKVKALKGKPASTDEYTPVDVENEKKIVKILSSHFPEDSILTEERKPPRQLKEFFWLVDPLDGSISYFFGLPYWSVSLALIHKNQPLVGVIYMPAEKNMYWGLKDKGAYRNGRKIKVSTIGNLEGGVIGIDYGYAGEREAGLRQVTTKLIDHVKNVVSYACVSGSDVLVAAGKLTAHIHHMARRFDHAAGALLVTEAGGKVSDTKGRPIDWRGTKPLHFVATNGKIQQQLLNTLEV